MNTNNGQGGAILLLSLLILLLAFSAISGCSSNAVIPQIIEAAAKDPATICLKVVYGPAVAQMYRTNAANAKVKCDNDGLSVESTAPPAIGDRPLSSPK